MLIINKLSVFIAAVSTYQAFADNSALILTPLIKEGKIDQARNSSKVRPDLFLGVNSFSGFLTVDERYDSNIFFWFFPVDVEKIGEKPWIIWLQGGPGASSVAGLFDEIGPFEYNDGTLKFRESSWTKDHSLLFIDNPIGAGFSFTNSKQGFATNMATYGNHLYSTVQQFLDLFPELREAPLYIAGESYAGRYVPALANEILQHAQTENKINLQGLMLGNPVLERENVVNISDIYYSWGLIDHQGLAAVKPLQDNYVRAVRNDDARAAMENRNQLLTMLEEMTSRRQSYNVLKENLSLTDFTQYIQKDEVKKAMHVGSISFTFSNQTTKEYLVQDFLTHTLPIIETLLEHYRILIYCGQLDLTAPCVPNAEARRKNWHWSKRDEFMRAPRRPWEFQGTVAGYVKSGGGFTEVLVRGAGHLSPMDAPAQIQKLISTFISNDIFPTPQYYTDNLDYVPDFKSSDNLVNVKSQSISKVLLLSLLLNLLLISVIGLFVVYRRKRTRSRHREVNWLYSPVNTA